MLFILWIHRTKMGEHRCILRVDMHQVQQIADNLKGRPEAYIRNLSATELFPNIKHEIPTFRTPHIWSDLSSAQDTKDTLKVCVSKEYRSDSDHSGLSIKSSFISQWANSEHFGIIQFLQIQRASLNKLPAVCHFRPSLCLNYFDSNLLITNFNNESVTISPSILSDNWSWSLYQHTTDGHGIYSVDLMDSLTLKLNHNVPLDGWRVNGRHAIPDRFPSFEYSMMLSPPLPHQIGRRLNGGLSGQWIIPVTTSVGLRTESRALRSSCRGRGHSPFRHIEHWGYLCSENCMIRHLTWSLHALSPQPRFSAHSRMAPVRKHRSGRIVRTDISYKPKRTGLIPISESTEDLLAARAGSDRERYFNLIELWQLYDRAEIIEGLDVLSPRHGLKASGPKIPMLMKWTECQDMTENPEAMERWHRLIDVAGCGYTRIEED